MSPAESLHSTRREPAAYRYRNTQDCDGIGLRKSKEWRVIFEGRTPGVAGGNPTRNPLFYPELLPAKLPLLAFRSCVVVLFERLHGDVHPVGEEFLAVTLVEPMRDRSSTDGMR